MPQIALLAIESSCDDTSAAVCVDGLVLSNIMAGQKVHEQYGGVVPELASRAHLQNIIPVVDSALKEAGIANSDLVGWWSVHMPKGTPQPILAKLESAFNEIAVSEETKTFLMNFGGDPFPGNSKMLKELLLTDTKLWAGYVKLAKIEPLS